jgi:L-iditol 2-dehydrogenase
VKEGEKMRKEVMVKPGVIEIQEAEKPVLKPGEVLINVKSVGICGSDVHIFHGKLPFVQYPVVQGHEATGVVVETCESKDIKVGDRVVIQPQITCGECYPCKTGKYHICDNLQIMGVHTDGVAAEYVAIKEERVTKIPADMPFDVGTMIEPLSVAVHAVNLAGDVNGKNVLVIGAGTIGNLVAQAAKAKGAKVMITGRTQYRLDYAKDFGIDFCINEREESVREAVAREFGSGADVAIECIGVDRSVNEALEYCRKGGQVVITGVFGEKQLIAINLIQDKELTVYGSQMYREPDYQESIALVQEGKVQLKPLITAHFALEEYDKAYEYMMARKDPVMKVIVNIE